MIYVAGSTDPVPVKHFISDLTQIILSREVTIPKTKNGIKGKYYTERIVVIARKISLKTVNRVL